MKGKQIHTWSKNVDADYIPHMINLFTYFCQNDITLYRMT